MIAKLIRWSVNNRFLVLMATILTTGWGAYATLSTPLDALPDLSDVQVIIRTMYPGQAPQVVENQITYPLTTTMLSVPYAKTVRGYSMFGDSFVYVLFEDGTDLYWARSRVLEYLSQVQGRLPPMAQASLGPDATGVGWIYEYALVDRTGKHDISELRAIQDWFLKYELKSVPNVAEVATIGGLTRQYQIVVDPDRLRAYKLPMDQVVEAIKKSNAEVGGSAIELAEAEYVVRAKGYLRSIDDFKMIPVGLGEHGTPILLRDVAWIQKGPELRRGIAELNGEGEVAGAVVILRWGTNAMETIKAVKAKMEKLKKGLPEGVEIVETYDRSALIERSVSNLTHKLIEEFVIVALVCAAFLFHLRSSLVAIVTLPLGILISFIVMHRQGINANIMSLGGIAIAIGAMVDAAVVMIENAHKKLEAWRHAHGGADPEGPERVELMANAAAEVGPALFFSLLIITLSFVPVFTLQAQEGRLFSPLAFTKTYAMAAAAGLSVTLVPVLMTLFIRGRIRDEHENPINRALIAAYRPVLRWVLGKPWTTLGIAAVAVAITAWPLMRLGSEFLPPLYEGDLLYMPTTLPGISPAKASEILQQTDRIIKTFPEVHHAFGKIGRAETATDPAQLEMVETTLRLKPQEEWPKGMTPEKLISQMDAALKIPGMGNIWVQPIRNRIDMLATGIKSPVGIKVAGPDLNVVEKVAKEVERVLKPVRGTSSAFAERVSGGRYITIEPDRLAAARYGMTIEDLQRIVSMAIGGENIGETVEGLSRFPINVRYPREIRDSVTALQQLPIVTMRGETVTLGQLGTITVEDGPPMIKSENSRPAGYVYVDIRDRDLGSYVAEAQRVVADQVTVPAGYSITWSGQFEYLERAAKRLRIVIPFTLAIIFVLLFLTFRDVGEAALIMGTLPFALVGGLWLLYFLGHNLSIASGIGFIALAGVASEIGVVMLVYLDHAVERRKEAGQLNTKADLAEAIVEGAGLRVRPIAMTVAVIIAGLLPLFFGGGTGSELMQRIAAPMVGGMVTAPLLTMLVVPAAYLLIRGRRLAGSARQTTPSISRNP